MITRTATSKIYCHCRRFSLFYAIVIHLYLLHCSHQQFKNEDVNEHDNSHHKLSLKVPDQEVQTTIIESFAISFDPLEVEKLKQRNNHSNLGNVLWVPGTDGKHQRTLDLWVQLTNKTTKRTVQEESKLPKGHYRSPHAVGCYLSHWNLLRTLAHRPIQLQPEAYLILEDDATCAPNLDKEIVQTIQHLPPDWDLLFVGGKPFSYFYNKTSPLATGERLISAYPDAAMKNSTGATKLRQDICRGDFGHAQGPTSPNGTRVLNENQPYWRSQYLTNTHSYVVNPKRIAHLVHALRPTTDLPVDVRLGDLMNTGVINAYMTSKMWCDQQKLPPSPPLLVLDAPQTWPGYLAFWTRNEPGRVREGGYHWEFVWQTQLQLDHCTF